MPKIPLTAETLNQLGDGYAGKAIDAALDVLNKDIADRGDDGKARTLTVTYTFTPSPEGRCKVAVKTVTKVPAYQPPETVAKIDRAAGGLVFNPDVPANPDQATLRDLERDE